jgi:hypothetical protein
MLAILAHSPGFMFEESIGSSNEIVSISQSNCFNSEFFVITKIKCFQGPSIKILSHPDGPPVYIKRILAFEFIIVF